MIYVFLNKVERELEGDVRTNEKVFEDLQGDNDNLSE